MTKQTIRITAEELQDLKKGYTVEIILNGVPAFLAKADYQTGLKIGRMDVEVNYYAPDPEDFRIEAEKPKKTFIGAKYEPNKMHVYVCKTHGKHPVHLIDGGAYITEDERSLGCEGGDMGWFWLNQSEYDYYKSKAHEIEIEG